MTITLPEWLVWLAVGLWCARCVVDARLAVWKYRLEVERRRNREHARRLHEKFMEEQRG